MLKKLIIPSLIVALAGCDMGIPDLNNPSVDSLTENPTPESVNAAATGLIIANRADYADLTGMYIQMGVLGREAYFLSELSDPRYITELLFGQALAPDGPFGGGFWYRQYNNIRNANTLLTALDKVVGLSAEQLEGLRGFAKTIKAMEFYTVVVTHTNSGAPIDVSRTLSDDLAPFVTEAEAYQHCQDLLDEAAVHLAAGGDAFSFTLPSGFTGFNTPTAFATFSAGIKARVALDAGEPDVALAALEDSFITGVDLNAQLDLGCYHSYSTSAGETQNLLANEAIYAHPSIRANAEVGDDRLSKIVAVDPIELMGASASDRFTLYPAPNSRVAILRNEELRLIRAEANWANGDLVDAVADINFIRNNSGGLGNTAAVTEEEIKQEILTQRRYSLLFEGRQWIDARRLGELTNLPNAEGGTFFEQYPVPLAEQQARAE